MLVIWRGRELTPSEAMALNVNPYQIFMPYRISIPTLPANTVTTVFRKTLSGLGTRVGSRQVHAWGD
jgi:hypothetical protein